jgi:hypothetical protein
MYGIGNILQSSLKRTHHNIHRALFFSRHTESYFNGKISEDVFWTNVIKENKWNASSDYLKAVVRDNFKEIPGTRDIIEKLGEKGYKLGLLSVHGKEWIDYCDRRFGYHGNFGEGGRLVVLLIGMVVIVLLILSFAFLLFGFKKDRK